MLTRKGRELVYTQVSAKVLGSTRTEIKKWGNGAALRLPTTAFAEAGLGVNSPVEIEASEGKLIVSAVTTPQYELD